MEHTVVKELNAFLKGNYMAIHGYEKYIQHTKDGEVKKQLQSIQQDHKEHAAMVAERIQNLGGTPVDGVGMMGTMAEAMNQLKGSSEEKEVILEDARNSEQKGIQMAEEVVKGDLDAESRKLIEKILDDDRKHVKQLSRWIH